MGCKGPGFLGSESFGTNPSPVRDCPGQNRNPILASASPDRKGKEGIAPPRRRGGGGTGTSREGASRVRAPGPFREGLDWTPVPQWSRALTLNRGRTDGRPGRLGREQATETSRRGPARPDPHSSPSVPGRAESVPRPASPRPTSDRGPLRASTKVACRRALHSAAPEGPASISTRQPRLPGRSRQHTCRFFRSGGSVQGTPTPLPPSASPIPLPSERSLGELWQPRPEVQVPVASGRWVSGPVRSFVQWVGWIWGDSGASVQREAPRSTPEPPGWRDARRGRGAVWALTQRSKRDLDDPNDPYPPPRVSSSPLTSLETPRPSGAMMTGPRGSGRDMVRPSPSAAASRSPRQTLQTLTELLTDLRGVWAKQASVGPGMHSILSSPPACPRGDSHSRAQTSVLQPWTKGEISVGAPAKHTPRCPLPLSASDGVCVTNLLPFHPLSPGPHPPPPTPTNLDTPGPLKPPPELHERGRDRGSRREGRK